MLRSMLHFNFCFYSQFLRQRWCLFWAVSLLELLYYSQLLMSEMLITTYISLDHISIRCVTDSRSNFNAELHIVKLKKDLEICGNWRRMWMWLWMHQILKWTKKELPTSEAMQFLKQKKKKTSNNETHTHVNEQFLNYNHKATKREKEKIIIAAKLLL